MEELSTAKELRNRSLAKAKECLTRLILLESDKGATEAKIYLRGNDINIDKPQIVFKCIKWLEDKNYEVSGNTSSIEDEVRLSHYILVQWK